MKNKLLYITDQEEYKENRIISTLFDIYLKENWNIDIVYITKYKYSFQKKDNYFIVPISKQKNIIEYLIRRDIDISTYTFIVIRNIINVLKNVLDNQKKFSYKIAYRISYPTKSHIIESMKTLSLMAMFQKMIYRKKIKTRDKLINECTLFLPSSTEAKEKFYSAIKIDFFPILSGLDPNKLNKNIINSGDIIKFIYLGHIDKDRKFNVILDAFSTLKYSNWNLTISISNQKFILDLLENYPKLKNNISIKKLISFEKSKEEINKHDIGIALMPKNKFYDTVVPSKIMNYYSCGLPSILTFNKKNSSILDDNEAFFSDFDTKYISDKINDIMKISREDYSDMGNRGQKKLLSLDRNYKTIAHNLSNKLNSIII